MPKSAERKARSRERIVAAAGRRFRAAGLEGAGVAEIMGAAGLTHGGFYAHFPNKAALAATALAAALATDRASWLAGLEGLPAEQAFRQIVARYLSRAHRDSPDIGCAMAALASEVARQDGPMRAAFEQGFLETVGALEPHMPDGGNGAGREQAVATTALALGGLLLARMVEDQELSDAILRACRRALLQTLKPR